MKKALLPLLLALALLLCGCGSAAPAAATPAPEPAPESVEATPAPTPEPTPGPTPEPDPKADARALIAEGRYDEAEALLAQIEGDDEAEALRIRAALGDPQPGDRLVFGRFEQDNVTENGPEEIEWVVLTREGDELFLLSLNALDSLPYHDVHYGTTTWKDCALRAYLNGEFLDAAFSGAELLLVEERTLSNPDNPIYATKGGEDTVDRVFLPSLDEALEYIVRTDFVNAHVTEYATARGGGHTWDCNGWYWLRTPGKTQYNACHISNTGVLSYYGYVGSRPHWVVRPAIWLDLDV